MPIRAGDSFWPTGPEFHPSAPFTIPGEWCPSPGPARSSLGRIACSQLSGPRSSLLPSFNALTLWLPPGQFLPVTNVAEAVGQQPPGLPAKAICLNVHFPGATCAYIWKWESPSVEREQDVFKGEERKPVWLSSCWRGGGSEIRWGRLAGRGLTDLDKESALPGDQREGTE